MGSVGRRFCLAIIHWNSDVADDTCALDQGLARFSSRARLGLFLRTCYCDGYRTVINYDPRCGQKIGLSLTFGVLIALALGLQTPQAADPPLSVWQNRGRDGVVRDVTTRDFKRLFTFIDRAVSRVGVAVNTFDLGVLLLFIGGGVIGILLMAHLIKALLGKYHTEVLSCLTGAVFGALVRVWPWQGAGDDGSLILLLPAKCCGSLVFGLSGFLSASLAFKFSTDNQD